MRRTISVASLLPLLLVPTSVTADDDIQAICTEVVVPPDHALVDSPALRGEPEGGECDAVVYLPSAIADTLALGTLVGSQDFRALTEFDELGEFAEADSTFGQLIAEAMAEEDEPPDDE